MIRFDATTLPTRSLKTLATVDTGFGFVSMMAVAGNRVWAASLEGLDVLEPTTGRLIRVRDVPAFGVVGQHSVLVTTAQARGVLTRYDVKTFKPLWEIDRDHPAGVAVQGHNLWLADYTSGTMSILDVGSGRQTGNIAVSAPASAGPSEPELVGGSVWVRVASTHEVVGVDVATRHVTSRVRIPARMKLCGKRMVAVGTILWVPDCSTILGRVDTATGTATFLDLGAEPGPPLPAGSNLWIPAGDRLVHVTSSATMDRTVSIDGVERIFEVAMASGRIWANVGSGRLAQLSPARTW